MITLTRQPGRFMNNAVCKSCKASIVWAMTTSGSRMPLDATPVKQGTFTLREDGRYLLAEIGTGDDVDRFQSHFATCPNADRHRSASR